jgi:hypothetical protein
MISSHRHQRSKDKICMAKQIWESSGRFSIELAIEELNLLLVITSKIKFEHFPRNNLKKEVFKP